VFLGHTHSFLKLARMGQESSAPRANQFVKMRIVGGDSQIANENGSPRRMTRYVFTCCYHALSRLPATPPAEGNGEAAKERPDDDGGRLGDNHVLVLVEAHSTPHVTRSGEDQVGLRE
jgi:hypothetical protein